MDIPSLALVFFFVFFTCMLEYGLTIFHAKNFISLLVISIICFNKQRQYKH